MENRSTYWADNGHPWAMVGGRHWRVTRTLVFFFVATTSASGAPQEREQASKVTNKVTNKVTTPSTFFYVT
jgi:hypothetical protein